QCRERLTERFALDVPQRHVDGREREREDSAGAGGALGRVAQLLSDGLHAQRVLADRERAELLDCELQGRRQRRAKEGDTQSIDTCVGIELHRDKLTKRPTEGRAAGERLIGGPPQKAALYTRDLHGSRGLSGQARMMPRKPARGCRSCAKSSPAS